ncbi:MAG: hypothetical protein GXX84_18375 [Acidobacteria bacterium]|nr:hypothetical protein [Acidobacteriota bacterium]
MATATWCKHCGRKLPDPAGLNGRSRTVTYAIVPDGPMFGILLNGEVMIHGLKLENAQEIVSILNSMN